MSSWFMRGRAGMEAAEKEQAEKERAAQQALSGGIFEFRQGNKEDHRMIFLDPGPEDSNYSPFFFARHELYEGKKPMIATCSGRSDCPACAEDIKRRITLVLTAIVRLKYNQKWHDESRIRRDSRGNQWVYQKMLLPLVWKAQEAVRRHWDKHGENLRFAVFDVYRGSSSNECKTGETFELDFEATRDMRNENPEKPNFREKAFKAMGLEGDPQLWTEPVNYTEHFAVPTPQEIRKIFGLTPPLGSDDSSQVPADDPFASQAASPERSHPADNDTGYVPDDDIPF